MEAGVLTAPRGDDTSLRGAVSTRELNVSFGAKQVLHGVTLDAVECHVLGLIGASGSGKTTFLRCLNRLTELATSARISGTVHLDGEDIYRPGSDVNVLRRRVGMVFQQPNPFPLSIFDNVAYALREQARRRPRRAELAGAVESSLRRAGLWDEVADRLDRPALSLSGGQQQRLCIARTLAAQPEVILMDEPASALDPHSTLVIEQLIRELRDTVTVVIVTHNMQQARRISDEVAFFHLGKVIEHGSAEDVFGSPNQELTREYVAGAFG